MRVLLYAFDVRDYALYARMLGKIKKMKKERKLDSK